MVIMHSPSKGFFVAVGNIINIMTVDLSYDGVSLVAQLIKNPPAMWETWVWSLGWEDSLEKGAATHSSILAWRIPQNI